MRLFLDLTYYFGFKHYQMDVNNAIVNGVMKEVYMEQPKWFEDSYFHNHIMRLKKALYGLM